MGIQKNSKHNRASGSRTRQHLSLLKCTNAVGGASVFALALLALTIISPSVTSNADAATVATVLPASVENKQILSVSLDKNSIYFGEVAATEAGQFLTEDVNVTVASNAEKGFKLYINTMEDTTAMSNVSTAGGEITSIVSEVTTDAMGSNFPANQWGYNIVDGKNTTTVIYKPINEAGHVEATSTSAPGSRDYTLGFATKLNTELPAGTYRNNMMVSAVTDPERILTLNNISTMQEMTHEICSNTLAANAADLPAGEKQIVTPGNEVSKQLRDTRDNKWYWVSKLADQNCWMTQNLDLDIDATKGLKATDTDITVDWNNVSQYPPTTTRVINSTNKLSGVGETNLDPTTTLSWNLGVYVLGHPLWSVSCGNNSVTWAGQCAHVGVYDVSDSTKWTPTYNSAADAANNGKTGKDYRAIKCTAGSETFNENNTALISTCTAGEYDPHYLIGNHYSWNAATAGSGGTLLSTNANDSICPKNWKLASNTRDGDSNPTTNNGSFVRLLSEYGFNGNGIEWYNSGNNASDDYIVASTPIYGTYAGFSTNYNFIHQLNQTGYVWSSAASSSLDRADDLVFQGRAFWGSAYHIRYMLGSVRCVAR